MPPAACLAGRAVARVQVAARSDLAAALVDAVQGLPDLLATGREPAFLAGLDEVDWRLKRADRRLALVCGLAAATAALLATATRPLCCWWRSRSSRRADWTGCMWRCCRSRRYRAAAGRLLGLAGASAGRPGSL